MQQIQLSTCTPSPSNTLFTERFTDSVVPLIRSYQCQFEAELNPNMGPAMAEAAVRTRAQQPFPIALPKITAKWSQGMDPSAQQVNKSV